MLVPAELAVDVNRDGNIVLANDPNNPANVDSDGDPLPVDQATQNKPFRFWVNPVPNNSPKLADLDNFTRLDVYVKGFGDAIANGQMQLGLKWVNPTGGSPSVKIWQNLSPNGGLDYEEYSASSTIPTQETSSSNFVADISGTTVTMIPTAAWKAAGLSNAQPLVHLLLEGTAKGKGQLVLSFCKADGTEIGSGGSVWLDLKDIKEMYQRGVEAPQPPHPYTGTTTPDVHMDILGDPYSNFKFVPDPNEDTSNPVYIVFVHGFNMTYDSSLTYGEILYKRLWQRGYKGRFAFFRWPTYGEGLSPFGVPVSALGTYNDSEYVAWNSGSVLKKFVTSLPTYGQNCQIDIIAHSMGNIVTGAAIKNGLTFNHYAMLHAATSASCYSNGTSAFPVTNPHAVPDNDPDVPTELLGYTGFLGGISGANIVNFWDDQDLAITLAWDLNNTQFKPQTLIFTSQAYQYNTKALSGEKLEFGKADYDDQVFTLQRIVTDPAEAKAYVDVSLTGSIGRMSTAAGVIQSDNLVDEHAMGGDHGYEWDQPLQNPIVYPFINALFDNFNIKTFK